MARLLEAKDPYANIQAGNFLLDDSAQRKRVQNNLMRLTNAGNNVAFATILARQASVDHLLPQFF